MRIIPAIDLIDGQCVRLSKGDYSTKKVYNSNPIEVAKELEANGISYLHLVDLDGAKNKEIQNLSILEKICHETNLIVDFGGGIKERKDIDRVLNAGAQQVTLGSIAVKNKEACVTWIKELGTEKIIIGADCRDRKIATAAWLETSDLDVIDFINGYAKENASYVVCTDIAKDGMLQGPSIDLYKEIIQESTVKLIASGGVSSLADLIALKEIGCDGAIVGKAIYEGKITLKEIQKLC